MEHSRRGFLGLLGAAAAFALDPERALWVPGAKHFSIPAQCLRPQPPFLAVGDIVTFGDWPEVYIVTEPAQSLERIGDARFKLDGWHKYPSPVLQHAPRQPQPPDAQL